ncbi:T9SS type A sorting domain-containing protein [Adhaeribacter soli]|uniref:T9SS type A sorting domain-containing protein n=1 Tax=Adhaeribacter soli TaxID=2607655 RepID=A0A5N1J348_9BACT|nr:T9SS type A sorting domain-containing protein [Adhaeribacter soli]KAA9338983.1 T9SS type A sorting domain-containing protein [Adhaeribacter soli]
MKKTSTHLLSLFTGLFLLMTSLTAQAQFFPAVTPDDVMIDPTGGNIFSVRNTGNDVVDYSGRELRVMTWDGLNPSFGWDFDYGASVGSLRIEGLNLGFVSDPDIVGDPQGSGLIAITYLLNQGGSNETWVEIHRFNGSTFNLYMPPMQVDNGSGTVCDNPNIDLDFGPGRAVITYEQGSRIYARVLDIFAPILLGNIFEVSGPCIGMPGFHPDVACYFDQNTGNTTVTFTYIVYNGVQKRLVIQQEDLNFIISNPNTSCSAVYYPYNVAMSEVLDYPRVAAPIQNPLNHPRDMHVVVRHGNPSMALIAGFTHHASSYGVGTIYPRKLNTEHNIYMCGDNSRPAVTYKGDYLIATWTYKDGCYISGDSEIIMRLMMPDGATLYPDYSLVNVNLSGDQMASSVSGRHNYISDNTFYSFFDYNVNFMRYKSSDCANTNLRIARPEKPEPAISKVNEGLKIYPVPVTGKASIEFSIGKEETGYSVEVVSITGKVVRTIDLKGAKEGNYKLEFNKEKGSLSLPAGVYLVKLNSSKTTKLTKFILQ